MVPVGLVSLSLHVEAKGRAQHDGLPVCRSFEQLRARYWERMEKAAAAGDTEAADVLEGMAETASAIKQHRTRRNVVKTQGVITLVGTCHVSEQSSRDVVAACNSARPSCLVLELCEERLLPCLVCPPEARAAWLGLRYKKLERPSGLPENLW